MSKKKIYFLFGVFYIFFNFQMLFSQNVSQLEVKDKNSTFRLPFNSGDLSQSPFLMISVENDLSILPVKITINNSPVWFRIVNKNQPENKLLKTNQLEIVKDNSSFIVDTQSILNSGNEITFECVLIGKVKKNNQINIYSLESLSASAERILKSIEIKIQE